MLVTVLQCPPGPPTPPVSSSSLWYVAKSWVLNTECKRCPFVFCKLQNPCLPPGKREQVLCIHPGFIEPRSSLLLSFKASELKMFLARS